ncbi:MAG: histidine phosphatase family protein [Erysipelotrichaceae bacterium]|nr:histidine phosphatase family protein [Erysipelotrichaceae bacterium]
MKKVRYYYVRHGETLFNRLNKMQGWCDSPLTEKGLQNGIDAGKALRKVDFRKVYSSPAGRCRDTVELVLDGRNLPVEYKKDLREMYFGDYEGLNVDDHLEEIEYRRRVTFDYRDVGGENDEMFMKRIMRALDEIYDESADGDNVLIISHGVYFLQLLRSLFDFDYNDFANKAMADGNGSHPIPNGYVGYFERDEKGYRLCYLHGHSEGFLATVKKKEK